MQDYTLGHKECHFTEMILLCMQNIKMDLITRNWVTSTQRMIFDFRIDSCQVTVFILFSDMHIIGHRMLCAFIQTYDNMINLGSDKLLA